MVLRLRGSIEAKLMEPFQIFNNQDRNYTMVNLSTTLMGFHTVHSNVLGRTILFSMNGYVSHLQWVGHRQSEAAVIYG